MAKRKWIQEATERMDEKGTRGTYSGRSVKQMRKDKAKGGAIGAKANFALNVRKKSTRGK